MKIMGLSNWLHWSAWFVKCLILLTVSLSLITILLCVPFSSAAIFENSDWTLIWFFFFVYSITTICFCFMISVFFSKANTAAGLAGILWFVSQLPFNVSQQNYDEMGTGAKIAMCLLSNSGMSLAMFLTVRLEATAAGLQWSNLFEPATIDDGFSVGLVIIMLLVDAAIYLLIALYVEQVMPGEFGVARPWYFPFTKEFWCRSRVPASRDTLFNRDNHSASNDSRYIEQDPTGYVAGVEIKQLRKVYKGNKAAVDGLNLRMYENQISVLLGHNGAGKTTTMSMLTGVFSPTSGTALINGHDIRTDIEGVRSSLGLCPQHNVLFDEMTVDEHLRFFSRLKGVPAVAVAEEIDRYLKLLELVDKRDAQSQTLSGGMKRKLAVGMALCGGSKVVLLDEPTSGMDPSARRALWNLLQKEKQNRTMLLSTHFMDEADVLGDRIAIMAEGKLKAVGSPFFLKKSFGVGYRLICVKDARCDRQRLLGILRRYIPDVTIDTDIGSELSFVLKEAYIDVFQRLLEDIEQQMESCGITSYGISLTTMEEVFLKAGSDSFDETGTHTNGAVVETSSHEYALDRLHLLTGKELLFNQIQAQVLKKFLSTIRAWIQLVMMFVIPIFFVCMTFIITRSISAGKDLPALEISMDSYEKAVTVLEATNGDPARIDAFKNMFAARSDLVTIDEDMTEYIVRKSKEDIASVNTRYFVGATISGGSTYVGWFNNKAFHTAPLALSLIYNAILRAECAECELNVINKPLPYRLDTQLKKLNTGLNAGFQLAFNTGFAMAFVSALYIMFYIKERTSRAKLLQFVSGTNVTMFWTLAFVWDYTLFVLNSLVYIATVAIFQEEGWSTFEELGRAFLLLLFFGFATLPVTYLFSFLFSVSATGFVRMMFINVLSGAIFFTAVNILKFDGIDLNDVAEGLEWVFLFFPNFVLSHGLNNLNAAAGTESSCRKLCELLGPNCVMGNMCSVEPRCCDLEVFSFGKVGIIRNLLFCLLIGCVCFGLLFAAEYGVLQRLFQRKRKPIATTSPTQLDAANSEVDSDVLEEKRRIQNLSRADIDAQNLLLRGVTKYYGSFQAVNNLSIGIDHSECFGLLGINGAGKTTTFKMMTGDEEISSGDAWVKGISLRTDMNRAHQQIGYCPQFDALLDDLTGRETLRIFALLRGVRQKEVKNVSYILAEELNFAKHLDKRTKAYSGGNKRKLSTALALLGNPSVVYLDEPTTGMDPGAKRQFWDVICKVRNTGKSIVLTSHSMEECEALCTRLAIMVNGEFKCLGSTQHLKNKFSEGFLLTVKTRRDQPNAADSVKSFVMGRFAGAVLKEEYQDSLTFHIARTDQRWSTMFGLMESSKHQLGIEDYALGQTTLEQVFLFFTKYQRATD